MDRPTTAWASATCCAQRGHRVVFAAEASWRGKLEPMGFIEDLVDLAPPPPSPAPGEPEPDAGQFWKDFVRDTAPEFRKPILDQLDTFVRPVFEELVGGARYCEPQLREIIARNRPDVIVQDNVVAFPALQTGGAPYVRIVSCNPLEVKGAAFPRRSRAARRGLERVGGVPGGVRPDAWQLWPGFDGRA